MKSWELRSWGVGELGSWERGVGGEEVGLALDGAVAESGVGSLPNILRMRTIGILCLWFAVTAVFAADPADVTGIWKWSTKSPGGEIPTTLKLEVKNGKIAGAYSNQYGATAISNASLQDGVIKFEVVRDLGGQKYVVKYEGKVEGDAIKGTIEAPSHDGGAAVKLEWNAVRTPKG